MLTARQEKLLKFVIQEFIETAEAVGSLTLGEKYDLEISPATIRNELAELCKLGLLDKTHASSGRVPTTRALKWFLKNTDDLEEKLDAIRIANIKEHLFQNRFNIDRLLLKAVNMLSELTNNTAVALFNNRKFTAGLASFTKQPEFNDMDDLAKVLEFIEDYDFLFDLFSKYSGKKTIQVLIGEETGIKDLEQTAVAFSNIRLHGNDYGYLGVIGPNRMRYQRVLPSLRYVSESIEDIVEGW